MRLNGSRGGGSQSLLILHAIVGEASIRRFRSAALAHEILLASGNTRRMWHGVQVSDIRSSDSLWVR